MAINFNLVSQFSIYLIIFVFQIVSGVPHKYLEKERILHDQRQDGELNVRADLKNIVVLFIPGPSALSPSLGSISSSSSSSPISTASSDLSALNWLNMFRASPQRQHHHHQQQQQQQHQKKHHPVETNRDHFIESKMAAPYHVDIDKSDSHLLNDEILATQSPVPQVKTSSAVTIQPHLGTTTSNTADSSKFQPKFALQSNSPPKRKPFAKAIIFTIPGDQYVLTNMEDDRKVVKKDGLKHRKMYVKKPSANETDELDEDKLTVSEDMKMLRQR